jgi:acyl-CoA thioesterase-1
MNRFLLALFALLLCLFTVPILAKNTILIVGDSISAGYGIDPQKGWVKLLQERLQEKNYAYQVINSSISGDTTSNGLNRLPDLLKQYLPQIAIIELGGNDGLRGIPIDTIKQNLERMIQLAKKAGSQIVLLGVRLPPNYGPQYTQSFQQLFVDLAKKENINLVPLFLNQVDDHTNLMQEDGIHPKEEAQMILLNNVWPTLEKIIVKK